MSNIDIQALAKQAGIKLHTEFPQGDEQVRLLERFAGLYREALIIGCWEPESFEKWNAKQHGDPEEIGFLQALRITYIAGQDSTADQLAAAVLRVRERCALSGTTITHLTNTKNDQSNARRPRKGSRAQASARGRAHRSCDGATHPRAAGQAAQAGLALAGKGG